MGTIIVVLGMVTAAVGVTMVVVGVPVREFSFGNTLIVAGTVAAVGGLIAIGLGLAINQLRRIAELLQSRGAGLGARPSEIPEAVASVLRPPASPASRSPFPPKPRIETSERVSDTSPEANEPPPFAPFAREEPPVHSEIDTGFSPPPAPPVQSGRTAPAFPPPLRSARERRAVPDFEPRYEPAPPPADLPPPKQEIAREPRRAPEPKGFGSMWTNESRSAVPAPEQRFSGVRPPPAPLRPETPPAAPDPRAAEQAPPRNDQRAAAILKSGVVDGMGYKLYVDGSIEAELPQGTVRFASIAELRAHLEKNS